MLAQSPAFKNVSILRSRYFCFVSAFSGDGVLERRHVAFSLSD
jgi:hypothetical protein